jgi:hypothetical protein
MHSDVIAAKTRIPRTVHRNRFELASWGVWLERMINRKRMNFFLRFTHVQESAIQRQNEIDRFRPAGRQSMGRQKGFQISDFRFQIRDSRFEIRDSRFEIFCGAWERLHILRTAYRLLQAGRLHLRFITHSVEDSQRNYHDSNHPKNG